MYNVNLNFTHPFQEQPHFILKPSICRHFPKKNPGSSPTDRCYSRVDRSSAPINWEGQRWWQTIRILVTGSGSCLPESFRPQTLVYRFFLGWWKKRKFIHLQTWNMQIYCIVGTLSENHMLKRKSDDLEYECFLFVSMWFSGFVWSFLAEQISHFPFPSFNSKDPCGTKRRNAGRKSAVAMIRLYSSYSNSDRLGITQIQNPFFVKLLWVSQRNAVFLEVHHVSPFPCYFEPWNGTIKWN